MKPFFALLKVSFRGLLLSASPSTREKKKAVTGFGFLLLMAGLMLFMSGMYSSIYAQLLAPLGRLDLLLQFIGLMAVCLCLFLGVLSCAGFIFGGKDNDILLALPVSSFTILLSKVAALYLENLVFSLFLLLPAGVICMLYGMGPLFLPLLLVCALLLPLLPTALCLAIGFLFSLLQSRVRHRALVGNLLYLVFIGGVLFLSFGLSYSTNQPPADFAALLQAATGWALPLAWMARGCTGPSLPALAGFAALCILPFFLLVWLFSLRYQQLLTRLSSVRLQRGYRLTTLHASGAFGALYKKEMARIFGLPVYLMNAAMGQLILLFAGGFLWLRGGGLMAGLPQGFSSALVPLGALLIAFCTLLCSTTSASISLEGNRLWILKEAPLPTLLIFRVKLLAHLTLGLPAVLVGVPLGCIGCGLSPLDGLLLALFGLACTLFAALEGLALNLLWPKMDGVNDAVIVKRSLSVSVQVFGCFGLLALGAGFCLLTRGLWGLAGALWCLTGLLALLCLGLAALLRGWGVRSFESLSSS